MLSRLRASSPKYNQAITFVNVDWDTFKSQPVTVQRKVPRRSTFLLFVKGKEVERLVAATDEGVLKAMLEKGVAGK
ncbi:MAG: thioredoxin family protein [Beijerinckiaceae bacterium]